MNIQYISSITISSLYALYFLFLTITLCGIETIITSLSQMRKLRFRVIQLFSNLPRAMQYVVELSLTVKSMSTSNMLTTVDEKLSQNYLAIVAIIYKQSIPWLFSLIVISIIVFMEQTLLDELLGILSSLLSFYRWQN